MAINPITTSFRSVYNPQQNALYDFIGPPGSPPPNNGPPTDSTPSSTPNKASDSPPLSKTFLTKFIEGMGDKLGSLTGSLLFYIPVILTGGIVTVQGAKHVSRGIGRKVDTLTERIDRRMKEFNEGLDNSSGKLSGSIKDGLDGLPDTVKNAGEAFQKVSKDLSSKGGWYIDKFTEEYKIHNGNKPNWGPADAMTFLAYVHQKSSGKPITVFT